MPKVIVLGAGVVGLTTAMLLARDDHEVVVLERDAEAPPSDPTEAWSTWERRGVSQFRLLHFFQPRFRQILESELPEVLDDLRAAGCLSFNPLEVAPAEITGGWRDDDDRFRAVTGRRPVVESVLARGAEATPGLDVRRGVPIAGLVTSDTASNGTPHVTGVRTEDGETIHADLVIDVTGRRSPLTRWLADIGARPLDEDIEDIGFQYYGRHFESGDGSIPAMMGPLLSTAGTVSLLSLPADNGTWGLGIISSARDTELRGLRDNERWTKVVELFPLHAHWLDGKPLHDVITMAKLEDRIRTFVVDGAPVVTGLLAVGDSWACTNPSLGRGATIGAMHALALRDLLRDDGADDPGALAQRWHEVTGDGVKKFYDETQRFDRHRLHEIDALSDGRRYTTSDPSWEYNGCLAATATHDGDLFRSLISIIALLKTEQEVFGDPAIVEKITTLGAGWQDAPTMGPQREQLLEIANS
jgi:2-polyprenyl-6-methoxyphenol hydroxylase-like FAD-dependent oxidoreductase